MATEKLRFEFDGDASKFKQAIQQSNKSVNNFGSNLAKIGGIIAGAFAIDRLIEFGGAVIETTGEFEKFEAVLTNTLGSKSQAQKALKGIKNSTCFPETIIYLDKNIPGWTGEINIDLISIQTAKEIVKRGKEREKKFKNKIPKKYAHKKKKYVY